VCHRPWNRNSQKDNLTYKLNLEMKSLLGVLIIIVFISGCTTESKTTKQRIDIQKLVEKHQILLTNEANFKQHTSLFGASSSLIRFRSKVFAVTAKHLIGKDGGVEPEIEPKNLALYFENWIMYPRVSEKSYDTIQIKNTSFNYEQVNSDILLLEVKNSKNNIYALSPNFELPNENDSLFIIGCPYSEVNCKQNIYNVSYVSFDPESKSLICLMKDKVELSGFSGAPIIDIEGKIVGILVGGWEENGKNYVSATSICEINNIK